LLIPEVVGALGFWVVRPFVEVGLLVLLVLDGMALPLEGDPDREHAEVSGQRVVAFVVSKQP
jgi:hypothetical protein